MTDLVVTKIAEAGNKFEEGGQCIASHDFSIVFLPHGIKPGELARVRLIPIRDSESGEEKKDKRGHIMYHAEWSLPQISKKLAKAISEEAHLLRASRALPRKEGEVALRILRGEFKPEWAGFDWYYFGENVVHGSRFSPSALVLLEAFQSATESGLVELLAWLLDVAYYKRRLAGQRIDRHGVPDLSDENIEGLQKSLGGWFSSGTPILSTMLA